MDPIEFLVDENAPRAATAALLEARGHIVHWVGEEFAKGSPDQLLVRAAEMNGLVLITFDKDFKRLIKQFPIGIRTTAERRAGRISLTCKEPEAPRVLERFIGIIEYQYQFAIDEGSRLVMQVSNTNISLSMKQIDVG